MNSFVEISRKWIVHSTGWALSRLYKYHIFAVGVACVCAMTRSDTGAWPGFSRGSAIIRVCPMTCTRAGPPWCWCGCFSGRNHDRPINKQTMSLFESWTVSDHYHSLEAPNILEWWIYDVTFRPALLAIIITVERLKQHVNDNNETSITASGFGKSVLGSTAWYCSSSKKAKPNAAAGVYSADGLCRVFAEGWAMLQRDVYACDRTLLTHRTDAINILTLNPGPTQLIYINISTGMYYSSTSFGKQNYIPCIRYATGVNTFVFLHRLEFFWKTGYVNTTFSTKRSHHSPPPPESQCQTLNQ